MVTEKNCSSCTDIVFPSEKQLLLADVFYLVPFLLFGVWVSRSSSCTSSAERMVLSPVEVVFFFFFLSVLGLAKVMCTQRSKTQATVDLCSMVHSKVWKSQKDLKSLASERRLGRWVEFGKTGTKVMDVRGSTRLFSLCRLWMIIYTRVTVYWLPRLFRVKWDIICRNKPEVSWTNLDVVSLDLEGNLELSVNPNN